jgi:hypothetical protein
MQSLTWNGFTYLSPSVVITSQYIPAYLCQLPGVIRMMGIPGQPQPSHGNHGSFHDQDGFHGPEIVVVIPGVYDLSVLPWAHMFTEDQDTQ